LLSPAERTLRARAAAHRMHGTNDSRRTSKPGRDAFLARFERLAREEAEGRGEKVSDAEILRRADQLKRSHMAALAFASAKARRKRRAS
jgi:hypothetical protein